jgi:hypothetical protein
MPVCVIKSVRYKKIRGLKRKVATIPRWAEEYSQLDTQFLSERKYYYAKVYVQPWDNLSFIDSQIPEPKGKAKKLILYGLEKIYNQWKAELEKLRRPYYLKVWLYEPRLSKSQVVCAIEEKIKYYEDLFENADHEKTKSSFINGLSPDFSWQSRIDEEPYAESLLLWPANQYARIEDCYSDRRLLNKLRKGNYRSVIIDNPKDRIYFLPKGKIWLGGK